MHLDPNHKDLGERDPQRRQGDEYDLIVTATGFDVSFKPSWNLVGRNGASLNDLWAKEPTAYFSMCAVDHPNYFIYAGPNSLVAHGVLPGQLDQSLPTF